MLKIDEKFLEEAGLGELPSDQKTKLISVAQEELEKRVGERMSEGMTISQLREFDGIMNNDKDTMVGMLAKIGDYQNDKIFQKLLSRHGVTEGNMEILGEYLSVKWVQMNRPDYAKITEEVAQELRHEIVASRTMLMAA